MLDGLDSIDWAQLTHAYGEADDVPALLRDLASPEEDRRQSALDDLFGNIWHQGTVYPATARAIPFLVELALAPARARRADILGLIGTIAHSSDGPREAHNEVVRHANAIAGLLADDDAIVRAGAAYVLGALYEIADVVRHRLRARVGQEPDALTRASILIALASLADTSPENVAWLERHFASCADERERFAAAFALAHCARAIAPVGAIELLANACRASAASSRRFDGFLWDLRYETMPREALVATGAAGHHALPMLLDALRATDDAVDGSFLLEDALAIVFGLDDRDQAPTELDEPQRMVLRTAADTPLVWAHPGLFNASLEYYCLPTHRAGLMALIEARPERE